ALGDGLSIEEAGIFLNIGWAQRLSGDNQNALQSYRKAFTMFQTLAEHPPDPQKLNNIRAGQGQAMENIGVLYEELGDAEAAVQWFGNALSLYRNGGNRQQEARMLGNMGTVYLALDDYLRASGLFTDALKLARDVADRATEAEALKNLADLSS